MSNRKKIFFTSDLHIGHKAVLGFSDRPFTDLDTMHKAFVKRFNSVLSDDSICYFLGDVGLCNGEIIKDIIDQIKGTKVLILGNHDKKMNAMYNLGFDVVMNNATLIIAGQPVSMSHCPKLGVYREDTEGMRGGAIGENWHGESRDSRRPFTVNDYGQYHLSGHIHSPNGGKSKRELIKQYDVGVDANNYIPVSISQIESWICKTERKYNDWRDIPEFDGYKVNYFGHIKSFKRYAKGKIVKPYTDKDGYLCNTLRQSGRSKAIKVHRAVALAFIPNPDNLAQVNHKNGHKKDNEVTNLEWISNIKTGKIWKGVI